MDDCVISWRRADYVLVISKQDVKISPPTARPASTQLIQFSFECITHITVL